jgi:hypothetical protein
MATPMRTLLPPTLLPDLPPPLFFPRRLGRCHTATGDEERTAEEGGREEEGARKECSHGRCHISAPDGTQPGGPGASASAPARRGRPEQRRAITNERHAATGRDVRASLPRLAAQGSSGGFVRRARAERGAPGVIAPLRRRAPGVFAVALRRAGPSVAEEDDAPSARREGGDEQPERKTDRLGHPRGMAETGRVRQPLAWASGGRIALTRPGAQVRLGLVPMAPSFSHATHYRFWWVSFVRAPSP